MDVPCSNWPLLEDIVLLGIWRTFGELLKGKWNKQSRELCVGVDGLPFARAAVFLSKSLFSLTSYFNHPSHTTLSRWSTSHRILTEDDGNSTNDSSNCSDLGRIAKEVGKAHYRINAGGYV